MFEGVAVCETMLYETNPVWRETLMFDTLKFSGSAASGEREINFYACPGID
jgi:hypothetical protein